MILNFDSNPGVHLVVWWRVDSSLCQSQPGPLCYDDIYARQRRSAARRNPEFLQMPE